MTIRPLHDRVVVKRLEAEEKTASGIVFENIQKVVIDPNHVTTDINIENNTFQK